MKRCFKLLFNFVIAMLILQPTFGQVLRLESTINSIGFYVENATNISNKVSYEIKFKEQSAFSWRKGLDASSFNYTNGNKLFAGSLLQLKPNTNYSVEVNIIDSFPTINTFTFSGNIATRAETNVNIATPDTLWVSAFGKGHIYSAVLPGAFDTLFLFDFLKVKCGTTILCKGGKYYVGDLNYNINSSPCANQNNPIIISAAPNEQAIFDGSDSSFGATYPNWIVHNASPNIYKATLPLATDFSTLFLYDTLRLFPYPSVDTLQVLGLNKYYREALINCANSFGSGFYRNGNNYFVKLANGENPNGKKITVSKRNQLLRINKNGANYNPPIIIKNITVKNYGKSLVSFNLFGGLVYDYNANALIFSDCRKVVVSNCNFEYNTMPILFRDKCDSAIIENNYCKDQTGKWMHGAFKNTSLTLTGDLNWLADNGKYGRGLEKAFVYFEAPNNYTTKNIIFRKNYIDGIVSGVAGRQLESSPFQDIDICQNTFANCFDAIDIVGNAANFRVWDNKIFNAPIVFSMIPFSENNVLYSNTGPAYFFRNIVSKSPTRSNLVNKPDNFNPYIYVNYGGCEGLQAKLWSTGLKMETGNYPTLKRIDVHFYHNTMYVEDSLSYNLFLWRSTWKKIISKNNSWNSKFNVVNFEDVANLPTYSFLSINDNYFSETNKLGVINKIHGNLNTCQTYSHLDSLDKYLRQTTNSTDTNLLKIKGFNFAPNFNNQMVNDFSLASNSMLINKGEIINNISDLVNENYFGNAPDIGAIERNTSTGITFPIIDQNTVSIFPNPSNGAIVIQTKKVVSQIRIYQLDGRLTYFRTYKDNNLKKNISFKHPISSLQIVHLYFKDGTHVSKTIF